MCDLRYRFDIGDRKKRISGSLYIDCLNCIIYSSFYRSFVRRIYDLVCDIEVLKYIIQDTESTAVDIVRYKEPITLLEQRKDRIDRCKTSCKCKSVLTLLKICDELLKSSSRRIARS